MRTGLHGVDSAMRERVRGVLRQVEEEHAVKVLYACESAVAAGALPHRTVITMCVFSMCINRSGICV